MSVKSLISASLIVSAGTIAGRVFGLLREMFLAAKFGASTEANIAVLLLIIPDFIASAFIGNASNATLMPEFIKYDEPKVLRLLTQVLVVSMGFFAAIALGIMLFGVQISAVIFHSEALNAVDYYSFLMVIAILPLHAAIAVVITYLQHKGHFFTPAFANVLLNIIIIAALWLVPGGIMALAIGICLATTLRLLLHVADLYSTGARFSFQFHPCELRLRLFRTYAITVGSCVLIALVQYAPYVIVGANGGSISLFNYAFKLVLLPCLLGQTIVQMVLLPWFVSLSAGHPEKRKTSYGTTLQLGWIFSLATCLSLTLVSTPLAMLCFGYGKMTLENIAQVSSLFALGVWAMPGMVLATLWQQMLYANEHTRAPFYASIFQAVLIFPLGWFGFHAMGEGGVLLAYAVVQWLLVIIPAIKGRRLGIITHLFPSAEYIILTLAIFMAFVPMAGLYHWGSFTPIPGVVLAGLVGMILLATGLLACKPVRDELIKYLANRRERA